MVPFLWGALMIQPDFGTFLLSLEAKAPASGYLDMSQELPSLGLCSIPPNQ